MMDIERELEILIDKHKGKQVGLGEIRLDWFAEDCLKEIRRLKSAIARQSIKSEEVQEAIEQLQTEYVDDLEGYPESCEKWNRNIDLAITALQAYQPTTRKDRTVEGVTEQYQPWIHCSERMPTANDADENGHILAYSEGLQRSTICLWYHIIGDNVTTHWRGNVEPPKGEGE